MPDWSYVHSDTKYGTKKYTNAPGTAPAIEPVPPTTSPTMRKMATRVPNWASDANGRLSISIEPASPP